MIYLTRQEQRIVILLSILILLSIGLLIVKRFQPAWFLWASMGKPDFDVQNPQAKPNYTIPIKIQPEQKNINSKLNGKEEPKTETQDSSQETKSEIKDKPKIDGKININTAGIEELDKLPGIGPVKAKNIIDFRKEHGNFKSIEEITNVKGIGDKTFENIKNMITIGE
ncbi:TPA: helix-hairpin-helix domain-containing protein [bacterium]|nr:helix-hairpin-helix domain-containing protein [bacterium]